MKTVKLFMNKKIAIMIFVLALALSTTYTASITSVQAYFWNSIELQVEQLPVHQDIVVLSISSGENASSKVAGLLSRERDLKTHVVIGYEELYITKDPIAMDYSCVNETKIELPKGYLIRVIAFNTSVRIKPVLWMPNGLLIGKATCIPQNTSFSGLNVTLSLYYSDPYGELNPLLNAIGNPWSWTLSQYTPTILIDASSWEMFKKPSSIELYGVSDTPIDPLAEADLKTAESEWIPDISYYLSRYSVPRDKWAIYTNRLNELKAEHSSVLFIKLVYDVRRVITAYSIDASLNNVGSTLLRITDLLIDEGCGVSIVKDYLGDNLANSKFMEFSSRFAAISSTFPTFIAIAVASSMAPSALLSLIRKDVALLRARGFSIKRVSIGLSASTASWIAVGFIGGYFLGPVIPSLTLLENSQYWELLNLVLEPISITVLAVMMAALLLLSLRKVSKSIEEVQPIELSNPTLMSQLITRTGMSWLDWFALALGTYFFVKVLVNFNIYEYIGKGDMPLIIVILLILLIPIDSLASSFGTILFPYGVVKLITSYPRLLTEFVGSIIKPVSGELKHLVVNLVKSKVPRIVFTVFLLGFASSILVTGVVGHSIATTAFNGLIERAYGNHYFYVNSVNRRVLNGSLSIINLCNRALDFASEIDGAVVFIISAPLELVRIVDTVEASFPLKYLVIVDSSSYSKVFNVGELLEGIQRSKVMLVDRQAKERGIYVIRSPLNRDINFTADLEKTVETLPGLAALDAIVAGPQANYTMFPSLLPSSIAVMDVSSLELLSTKLSKLLQATTSTHMYITEETPIPSTTPHISQSYEETVLTVIVVSRKYVDAEGSWSIRTSGSLIPQINTILFGAVISSYTQSIISGSVLYASALAFTGVIVYASTYENLHTYALLRARGFKRSDSVKITIAESIALSLLGLIPGVALGVIVGLRTLDIMTISGGLGLLDLKTVLAAYRVSIGINWLFNVIAISTTSIAIAVATCIMAAVTSYKRILREAIALLGAHI
ncbi:MAG: ABC transporter permease [Desulfurococcaceae archaeon]|nr:ABC transporter permease [Sulfolobales archaeon]MDW8169762.1 ABC transporter permease [Desulfurococcaceae archaeon]